MATRKVRKFNDGGDVDGPGVETSPVYMASATGVDLPPMEEEKAAPAKAKAKVVSKKELDAFRATHGADKDLRDYMNKQQGLTRRGGAAPAATPAPVARKTVPEPSPSRSSMLTRMREADKAIKGVRGTESAPVVPRGITRINPDDLKGQMKGMGGASGFAKGGKVGSASRRADGCAMRGKTRA